MAVKKKGLGRGLDSLIINTDISLEDTEKDVEIDGLNRLDINSIRPNENQPRKVFDPEKIEELANSIKEHGVIQPIVVRNMGDGYEIVAGERRWRAARKAGLNEVPCIVRELTDEQNMLFAIIENMQREDLNPIEEAQGLDRMIKSFGLTQEEVSKSVGKSRPYISNSLRLLKLPDEIKDMMSERKLSAGHARALINMGDEEKQIEAARRIVKEGLSVRDIENLSKEQKKSKRGRPAARRGKSPDVKLIERELMEIVGTKVNINEAGKRSSIEIECHGTEELERIIELLKTLK